MEKSITGRQREGDRVERKDTERKRQQASWRQTENDQVHNLSPSQQMSTLVNPERLHSVLLSQNREEKTGKTDTSKHLRKSRNLGELETVRQIVQDV